MLVSLALGAELDIASGQEVKEHTGEVLDALGKNRRPRPLYYTLSQAVSFTPPATRVVKVGTVPLGKMWDVLAYSLTGQNETVQAASGVVALYVGQAENPVLSQLIVSRRACPDWDNLGPGVYWAMEGDDVFFSLNALATVTQFVGNVRVAEYRADEILQKTGR